MTGQVHSLETLGTSDGPGIRLVVFMQGCALRCIFCHNPDTWSLAGGTPYEPQALAQVILRYKPYFDASNGGVTLSGGEPLLQATFAVELFNLLKAEGIHTCLDTSGHAPGLVLPVLDDLLDHTDLVLLSIKHGDETQYERISGCSAPHTKQFLNTLKIKNIPVWLRYVVIPGLTDSERDIEAIKALQKEYPVIRKIEWLPFHQLGVWKWKALGLNYGLKDVPPPSEAFMKGLY